MVNHTYNQGAFQQLLQAVPVTALVCAATIALLLLLLRILAQSLRSQQRPEIPRMHPLHLSHLQTREFDPYWPAPAFGTPGPARALDFMGTSSSSYLGASVFDSFESYPRVNYNCNLAETLSIEVITYLYSDFRHAISLHTGILFILIKGGFNGTPVWRASTFHSILPEHDSPLHP